MYRIEYSKLGLERLEMIPVARDANAVTRRIGELSERPDHARKLKGNFIPYRSAHAAHDRYRIIFAIEESTATVRIEFVGRRLPDSVLDVYAEFERLVLQSHHRRI